MNYYNEHDPHKAAWLRELIRRNAVAPGIVDERSITDVQPADLDGYVQCHFFAGIGVWSYALRLAGWPDDRPVWTGSCPCQPFSAAGKRLGTSDERHLWPAWFRLIEACRPERVFGEQVASADGLAWLDDVRSDLDSAGYACGAVDLCSAGFGAPHLRQRLYFVGDAAEEGLPVRSGGAVSRGRARGVGERSGDARGMGDAESDGRRGRANGADGGRREYPPGRSGETGGMDHSNRNGAERAGRTEQVVLAGCDSGGMADAGGERIRADGYGRADGAASAFADGARQRERVWDDVGEHGAPGPTSGFWRDAGWVLTRPERVGDGPGIRPVRPCSFEMADGSSGDFRSVRDSGFPLRQKEPARILRLRGYGDAICAPVAAAFIGAYMQVRGESC